MTPDSFIENCLRPSFENNMSTCKIDISRSHSPEVIEGFISNDYTSSVASAAWFEWQKAAYVTMSWTNYATSLAGRKS